ncbi:MAG: hypothetical protein R2849_02115 [Thermomicrobiales bacterium]
MNKNISEIVARVRERAVSASDGEWIEARGYDQARLDDQRHPTRGDLDPVSAANPVILVPRLRPHRRRQLDRTPDGGYPTRRPPTRPEGRLTGTSTANLPVYSAKLLSNWFSRSSRPRASSSRKQHSNPQETSSCRRA